MLACIMYIATTFTGNRGWIFFSGDRPEITVNGRTDRGGDAITSKAADVVLTKT